ncbi:MULTISPECIES: S1 RNA-binding domain protein [Amycolatopsis]|uniref:S1 motif domain-containing protein n=1 Tax=Amycolatopsis tucumanensis TaxID=401106 RepID=A0ABP7HVU3_9PSEU|nr:MULTISPECIES: S1 RNA-binding domain protein [Amycolatopsis]MCF6424777.1 RNA-binding protein [Amycolatopsis tucumanensis]
MMNDAEWAAAKERFPIGSVVEAVVAEHLPFGMIVTLPGEVPALIDAISYRPGGEDVFDHSKWPAVGEPVHGTIADHRDRNRQIQVRVGPPVWEKTGSDRS